MDMNVPILPESSMYVYGKTKAIQRLLSSVLRHNLLIMMTCMKEKANADRA